MYNKDQHDLFLPVVLLQIAVLRVYHLCSHWLDYWTFIDLVSLEKNIFKVYILLQTAFQRCLKE